MIFNHRKIITKNISKTVEKSKQFLYIKKKKNLARKTNILNNFVFNISYYLIGCEFA